MKIKSYKELVKEASSYIELYINPVKMAMNDLETGKLKDPSIISIIGELMDSESSHKKEVNY